jgi:hypothetical protein
MPAFSVVTGRRDWAIAAGADISNAMVSPVFFSDRKNVFSA